MGYSGSRSQAQGGAEGGLEAGGPFIFPECTALVTSLGATLRMQVAENVKGEFASCQCGPLMLWRFFSGGRRLVGRGPYPREKAGAALPLAEGP